MTHDPDGDPGSPASGSDRSSLLKLLLPSAGSIRPALARPGQLRNDLFGGLTAAVVALPLALAFRVASGTDRSSVDTAALIIVVASLSRLVLWPARLGALVPAPPGVLVLGTLAVVTFAVGPGATEA